MKNNFENEIWAKTLISIYRFMPAIADAIDNLIKRKTINSQFLNNPYKNSTYEIANSVIDLTERKIKLINLKVTVKNAVSNLNLNDKRILVLYYIDGVSVNEIVKMLNISIRTFFRRKSVALKNLAKNLVLLGYSAEKLNEYLNSEHWLLNTYKQHYYNQVNHQKIDNNLFNYKLLKNVMFEINNPFKENYKNYRFSS